MALQNNALREVQNILLPSMGVPLSADEEPVADTDQSQESELATNEAQSQPGLALQQPSRPSSHSTATATTSEFIPQIFYSLHQIRKEPNNISNQLETSTAFIKHRLKSCKALIASDENCRNLLSRTPQEWQEHIQNREKEVQVKRKVLEDLKNRISALQDKQ